MVSGMMERPTSSGLMYRIEAFWVSGRKPFQMPSEELEEERRELPQEFPLRDNFFYRLRHISYKKQVQVIIQW